MTMLAGAHIRVVLVLAAIAPGVGLMKNGSLVLVSHRRATP
jgi:hypothetical protein